MGFSSSGIRTPAPVFAALCGPLCAALLLTNATFAKDPKVLRFAAAPSPPHVNVAADGTAAGANVDLFTEAARRAGYKAEWVPIHGDPTEALQRGEADIFHAAPTVLFPRAGLRATRPWVASDYVALHVEGMDPAGGLRIAHVPHPVYVPVRQRVFPNATHIPAANAEAAILALCAGQADGAVLTQETGPILARGRPPGCQDRRFTWISGTPVHVPIAIACRAEFFSAADAIYDELTLMAMSGELEQLYADHGVAANGSLISILTISEVEQRRDDLRRALIVTICLTVLLLAALGATLIMNRRARQARREAEVAGRVKSDFLTVMSHEIRTPLNGFLGMNTLLLGTPLSPLQREYAQTADRCARELHSLLGDILDLNRVDEGKLELHRGAFALRPLAADVARMAGAAAGSKPLRVFTEFGADLPEGVFGDELRVRQVLLNLAMNAQKFTQEGRIVIRVNSAGSAGIRFSVEDTGPGMEAGFLARAFDRFEQADSSTTRPHGGSGLGLAIAKELVERMGGRIGAESEPGRGSTFWFTLPLPEAAVPAAPTAVPVTPEPAAARDAKVLIAEDNMTNRRLIYKLLERLGYKPEEAIDGAEAVRLAATGGYHAILMDCQMPAMDGYQATREIRRQEDPSVPVPIIALTADVSVENRTRCTDAGMNDFLGKPVLIDTLDSVLARWVRN